MKKPEEILSLNGITWDDSDKGIYLKLKEAMNQFGEQSWNAARMTRFHLDTFETYQDYLKSLK